MTGRGRRRAPAFLPTIAPTRTRWGASAAGGAADAPLYLAGTDFFVLADDGRVQTVAGFVDSR